MFDQVREWWHRRATQQLNRDARDIIRRDIAAYTDRHMATIANLLHTYMSEIESDVQTAGHRREVAMRLQNRHREARRRNDQAVLSAATLAIIYRRALDAGPSGSPARDAVRDFVARYVTDEPVKEAD